jgi:GT2 family glycosyltransferase
MTEAATPIAVVIATRGRPEGAARAVRSVLHEDSSALSLVLVDQNENEETCAALQRTGLLSDRRLRVVRSPSRGLGAARNLGVRHCDAPLIAFTDDDCEATGDWSRAMAAAFEPDPRIGMAFGTVLAAEYDRGAGFIPAYLVGAARSVAGISRKANAEGVGACMAVRRSAWTALGGFDEALGAGARLPAAEDTDLVVRMLVAGHWVVETPDAVVTHHGFRSFANGVSRIDGYMLGLGAVNAKMLRLGGIPAVLPVLALGWRWLARSPVVDLNQHPPRLRRLRAFTRGAWLGLRTPLGPDGHFHPR